MAPIPYQRYRQQLLLYAQSPVDKLALATLPAQLNEPVTNLRPNMFITTVNARAIGYAVGPVPQDSTVYFDPAKCNFDRVNINPNKYVLIYKQ